MIHGLIALRRFAITCTLVALTLAVAIAAERPPMAHAAAYVVSTLADSGPGSLRQAMLDANAAAGADTITFSVSGTITLASALPDITDSAGVTIDGTGQSVTVSGNRQVRPVAVVTGAQAVLRAVTVTGGTTSRGGGIRNDGTLAMTHSAITSNNASYGGAIFNTGTLALANSSVVGNVAAAGSGIYNEAGGLIVITASTISDNGPGVHAGGVFNAGTAAFTNSTISNNAVGVLGGGIYNVGVAALTQATVSGNTSDFNGGGVFTTGTAAVSNSLIAGNTSGGGQDCNGAVTLVGPNLIGTTAGCNVTGTPPIKLDPKLGPLASNGGFTKTHALLPSSPAIDAGDDAVCGVAPVSGKDQRGFSRLQGAHCDIGAYEANAVPMLAISDQVRSEGDSGAALYDFTVSLSGMQTVPVVVHFATSDGTAAAPSDYTAVPDTLLTFAPGETAKTVTVAVNGDATVEPHETFFVNLSNASDAVIADSQGLGTISNDDVGVPDINVAPGSLSFGTVPVGTTSSSQQVTVRNLGAASLDVGLLSMAGTHRGDFLKTADTCSGTAVAPAGECTVTVAFHPVAPGLRTATLVIPSNDPDENPVDVTLSGTGATIGGKNLHISTGSIDLGWDGGTAQTSYALMKYNTSTAAADLIPLAGAATSYSDAVAASGVVYCYVLAALGPSAMSLGLSDLLCGLAGVESGTAIPQEFSLALNQTANATMTWSAPAGGADSYVLQRIPLDGAPITNVPLSGGVTSSSQAVVAAGTCFQLIAFKGAGFGTSDVLCGVPGVSTLGNQPAGKQLQSVADAMADVQLRLAGMVIPKP